MHRNLVVIMAAFGLAILAAGASAGPIERSSREYGGRYGGRSVEDVTLLRIHGGLSLPSGDFGDAFDMGFGIGANIAHGVSRNVLISGGFAYHRFDGDEGFGGNASIVPITGNVEYVFSGSSKMRPWISGGIGFYNVSVETDYIIIPPDIIVEGSSEDETNFGINLGAGFSWSSSRRGVWGAGFRYHHIEDGDLFPDTDFVALHVGYGFFL